MANRTLSDADVKAISDSVVKEMETKFLLHVGTGVMKYVWAAVMGILLYLAATGYKGH